MMVTTKCQSDQRLLLRKKSHGVVILICLMVASFVPVVADGIPFCLEAVKIADRNHNRKIDRGPEYVSFLNLLSDNTFGKADFTELPMVLQDNYLKYTVHEAVYSASSQGLQRWEEVLQEFCCNSTTRISQLVRDFNQKHLGPNEKRMLDEGTSSTAFVSTPCQAVLKLRGTDASEGKKSTVNEHRGRLQRQGSEGVSPEGTVDLRRLQTEQETPSQMVSRSPSRMPRALDSKSPSTTPTKTPTPSWLPSQPPTGSVSPSYRSNVDNSQSLPPSGSISPSLAPTTRVPNRVPSYTPSADRVSSSPPVAEPSGSFSPSVNVAASYSPTIHPTNRLSQSPSVRPSHSVTPTIREYPTATPSVIPSHTIAASLAPTYSHTPSTIPSLTPSQSISEHPSTISLPAARGSSLFPSMHPTSGPSCQPSRASVTRQAPSASPSQIASKNHMPSLTMLPSTSLWEREVPLPSYDPSQEITVSPSVVPSTGPSAVPTSRPSVLPSLFPSALPTPEESAIPTTPTGSPSNTPTSPITENPTFSPTGSATTTTPTRVPTRLPTGSPTQPPTASPSFPPSSNPSFSPSINPTLAESSNIFAIEKGGPSSFAPTRGPSSSPSTLPSFAPSDSPSFAPSDRPSSPPSVVPSISPSLAPSNSPSQVPFSGPSPSPTTQEPSAIPSSYPSSPPSVLPSATPNGSQHQRRPSTTPLVTPSSSPSETLSLAPSDTPSTLPSALPSAVPSAVPSKLPSSDPSVSPSLFPTRFPSTRPSDFPGKVPSTGPSFVPSKYPSSRPTGFPSTTEPSIPPTGLPSAAPSVVSASPSRNPSLDFNLLFTSQEQHDGDEMLGSTSNSPSIVPSFMGPKGSILSSSPSNMNEVAEIRNQLEALNNNKDGHFDELALLRTRCVNLLQDPSGGQIVTGMVKNGASEDVEVIKKFCIRMFGMQAQYSIAPASDKNAFGATGSESSRTTTQTPSTEPSLAPKSAENTPGPTGSAISPPSTKKYTLTSTPTVAAMENTMINVSSASVVVASAPPVISEDLTIAESNESATSQESSSASRGPERTPANATPTQSGFSPPNLDAVRVYNYWDISNSAGLTAAAIRSSSHFHSLLKAYNEFVSQIIAEWTTQGGGTPANRQRLEILFAQESADIYSLLDSPCPAPIEDQTRLCQKAFGRLDLHLNGENGRAIFSSYINVSQHAIQEGRLQMKLQEIDPNSMLTVMRSADEPAKTTKEPTVQENETLETFSPSSQKAEINTNVQDIALICILVFCAILGLSLFACTAIKVWRRREKAKKLDKDSTDSTFNVDNIFEVGTKNMSSGMSTTLSQTQEDISPFNLKSSSAESVCTVLEERSVGVLQESEQDVSEGGKIVPETADANATGEVQVEDVVSSFSSNGDEISLEPVVLRKKCSPVQQERTAVSESLRQKLMRELSDQPAKRKAPEKGAARQSQKDLDERSACMMNIENLSARSGDQIMSPPSEERIPSRIAPVGCVLEPDGYQYPQDGCADNDYHNEIDLGRVDSAHAHFTFTEEPPSKRFHVDPAYGGGSHERDFEMDSETEHEKNSERPKSPCEQGSQSIQPADSLLSSVFDISEEATEYDSEDMEDEIKVKWIFEGDQWVRVIDLTVS